MGVFAKILNGLKKTKENLAYKFAKLFKIGVIGEDFYEELEEILLSADVGGVATMDIVDALRERVDSEHIRDVEKTKEILKEIMLDIVDVEDEEETFPLAIMVVGVNGVGKTTTIGKLANYYKNLGKNVCVVAADTFRAAAADQLTEWSKRVGVKIIKQNEGADPSAVVFDAVHSANAKNIDVLIVDTAGRLHNKSNLMEELKKMERVLKRECNHDNVKNYIVLDATTGQNAISQVKYFDEAVDIDGIILTKLDGTAKGGVIFAINSDEDIRACVKFIGVGEQMDDLQPFNAQEFIEAII